MEEAKWECQRRQEIMIIRKRVGKQGYRRMEKAIISFKTL